MISDYSLLYSQAWSYFSLSFTVSKIYSAVFGSWISTHPRCFPLFPKKEKIGAILEISVSITGIRFQEGVDSRRAVDVPSNVAADWFVCWST